MSKEYAIDPLAGELTRDVTEASRGLSFDQKFLLNSVLKNRTERYARLWWMPWRPSKGRMAVASGWTRVDSASISRCLRRLEGRGLVERTNDIMGGKRTTLVRLTPLGEAVANRLSKMEAPNDNRCLGERRKAEPHG